MRVVKATRAQSDKLRALERKIQINRRHLSGTNEKVKIESRKRMRKAQDKIRELEDKIHKQYYYICESCGKTVKRVNKDNECRSCAKR